ncbi:MAG: hypothetical protein IPK82_23625 [Polyangiaceae bacterium]|nr:hypothetical protein [Polyangiaceae bacterium]
MAKVIGHAELYEATDFEEYRDHKHEIIRRVGLAILTDATAPDPDDVPMLEPTAAPLTYPARQEYSVYCQHPTHLHGVSPMIEEIIAAKIGTRITTDLNQMITAAVAGQEIEPITRTLANYMASYGRPIGKKLATAATIAVFDPTTKTIHFFEDIATAEE